MATLNLKSLDPADLMPAPEVPESYGPRNDEDVRVYAFVKEALNACPGTKYDSVEDFMRALLSQGPR